MLKKLKSKKFMALAAALMIGAISFSGTSEVYAAPNNTAEVTTMKNATITNLNEESRVFKVDPSIETKFVKFYNRYGIEVAGHLYLPKNFNASKKYSAIAVSGAFGAVKEQHSGLYAQEMAKRGFVAIAFDPSFCGESGANMNVHNVGSPDIFTEDFSAAVDFLGSLNYVDREKIGVIGICGLSGPAITAATNDVRIKAVAVSAMYDMHDSIRNHYKGDYYTPQQREIVKNYLADMRWKELDNGGAIPGPHEVILDKNNQVVYFTSLFPEKLPDDADAVAKDFFGYYCERAYHPRSINSASAWSSTTPYGFFNFSLTENVEELAPRPLMLITGDKAHSRYHSENVYARAKGPKELVVVPGATHCDLYDDLTKIPFDKLNKFFKDNLR